jgi:hypothetical protein
MSKTGRTAFDALPYDEQIAILRSGDDRQYEKWGLAEYDIKLAGLSDEEYRALRDGTAG